MVYLPRAEALEAAMMQEVGEILALDFTPPKDAEFVNSEAWPEAVAYAEHIQRLLKQLRLCSFRFFTASYIADGVHTKVSKVTAPMKELARLAKDGGSQSELIQAQAGLQSVLTIEWTNYVVDSILRAQVSGAVSVSVRL